MKRTKAQQRAKIARRSDKRARRADERTRVICDACGTRQPFSRGNGSRHASGELDIAGCVGCGHHYGTWA